MASISPLRVFFAAVDPRQKSLLRSGLLVIGSLVAAVWISGWPDDRPTLKLAIPTFVALLGCADTFRCLRDRWNFYHGAVVVMLYADVMAVSVILFLFLYPYGEWIM